MDELEQGGFSADSPAADPQIPDTSAGTENTAPQGPGPIPYPRFQEMVHARQAAEQRAAALEQQYAQLQQRIQYAAQQQRGAAPRMSAEQQAAAQALKEIFQADPELRQMWAARQAMPHLLNGYQQTQQLQQIHQQNYIRSGRGEIERMATESQVPITPDAVDYYEELVAGVIRRTPGGQARFQAGDLSVLSEAWGAVKTFLGQFQRPAQQQLIDTKQQVRRLPPRPSGGAPGQALPPKIGEDANQFQRDMHSRFEDLVRNSGGPAR